LAGTPAGEGEDFFGGRDKADDAAHLCDLTGEGDAARQIECFNCRAVEFDGAAEGAVGAEALQDGEGEVAGGAGGGKLSLDDDFHGGGDLEPGFASFEGEGDVLVAHALTKGADGAQDVEVAVGADKGGAGVGEAVFYGDVGADAGVDVVYLDALLPRPDAAGLLVVGVGDVVGGDDEVKGEEGLFLVGDGYVAVMGAIVFDDVCASKVAGRAHVEVEPDDVSRFDGDVSGAVGLEDLGYDGLSGHGFTPFLLRVLWFGRCAGGCESS